jgi:Mg2+ and Co2+ transporter CorA
MNATRRKEISKALELISQAQQIIQAASEQEQEYFDNMPEAFQDGEKGQRASDVADGLGDVAMELETMADTITELMEA